MKVIHRGLILTGVPLILSVTLVFGMFLLILQADAQRQVEARHRRVSQLATSVMLSIYDAGISLQDAIKFHDTKAKQRFRDDIAKLRDSQQELQQIGKDELTGEEMMQEWQTCIEDSIDQLRQLLPKNGHIGLSSLFGLSKLRQDFSRQTIHLIYTFHRVVAKPLAYLEHAPERERNIYYFECGVLLSGVIGSVLLAFFLSRWFMRGITERLRVIAENSVRLSKEEALLPLVRGDDEIAALDSSFHTMAAHLMKSLAKERAIFQSASDMICVFDANGKFVALNPACGRILGFNPQDLVGATLLSLTFEEDVSRTAEKLDSIKNGDPTAIFESRVRMASGEYLDLLWSLYWSRSQALGFAVAHDISEAKRVERMKEEFLGMVSHDLRSPLASIYGTFQLMQVGAFGKFSDPMNDKIEMVTRNASRLLRLINDLLDIGKLETGMFELARQEDTEIQPLLARAAEEVQPLADKRGIKIIIQSKIEKFNIDPDRLMQVLVNLVSNAVKFSPDGGEVYVRAWQTGDNLKVAIIDQGRGVPPSFREAIFQRFKQVEIADGKSKGGTGLGLPICKQIVELHGGEIGVESPGPDQGSTFWFVIPSHFEKQPADIVPAAVPVHTEEHRARAPLRNSLRLMAGRDQALGSEQIAAREVQPARRKMPLSFADLPLSKKGAILVIVPVVFEIAFAGSMFGLLYGAFQAKQQQQHERAIATHAANLLVTFYTMGTIMANEEMQVPLWNDFQASVAESDSEERTLLQLTKNQPQKHALVEKILTMIQPATDFVHRSVQIVYMNGGPRPELMSRVFESRTELESVLSNTIPLMEELAEKASADEENASLNNRAEQGFLMIGALAISAAICAISAALFSTGITRRLSVISDNTRKLDAGQMLNSALPGEDEIAALDHVFHSMAMALKEAQDKEKAVFNNSAEVMCVVDSNGIIKRINPACARMWGFQPQELVDQKLEHLMIEADREATAKALSNDPTKSNRTLESRIVCKDQSVRVMHWALSWSAEENGNIAIAHDITKRKELEQLKQEFLSMVSHDMRTPLSAIQGITKLMTLGAFGHLPEKAAEQLARVERSCNRLLALVNDLLDMDKLESGNMQLAVKPTQALDIAERTCQALESFAKQHNASVTINISPDLIIEGDGDRLVQVGVNLISNALKYSPEGGVVELSAFTRDGVAEFRITDHGPGIPPQYLDKIFERYTMAPSVDGKKRAGTGLGLPICKQIVEQHGGSIGVESQVGKGSTFWFTVPLASVDAAVKQ